MGYRQERKSNAGRKRIDPLILFKMLVLQQLFNLSDEELEFQINDRRSFEEFVGLGVMNDIPDATTVAFFRERLRKAGASKNSSSNLTDISTNKGLKPVEDRLLKQLWFPSQSNAIAALKTRTLRQDNCPRDGMILQIDCSRRI